MMITEHNCEDYFLLYTDNELTDAERRRVEDFVSENPQYLSLFNALQQTKLTGENEIFFPDKKALYKDETDDIGISNYEEYFLLYADNELSNEKKEATERFVLQHPQLQEEFILLQQTKLTPELIEYEDKEELYKKERRVLPIYIAGFSAAAAVFAILFFAGLFTPKHQPGNSLAATTVKPDNNKTSQPVHENTVADEATSHPVEEGKSFVTDKAMKDKEKKEVVKAYQSNNDIAMETPDKQPLHVSSEEIAIAHRSEEESVPQMILADGNLPAKSIRVLKPLDDGEDEQASTVQAFELSDNNMAQPAVYKELNTDDDSHTLYVSGLPINKNKVNGILKSASRLLGGKAKPGEE